MYELPETGFLRLPQIIGDPSAEPPRCHSGGAIHLVGRRQVGALPQAGEARATDHGLAGGGHPRADQAWCLMSGSAAIAIEEVAAVAPSLIPLDAACRGLRRTLCWPPAVADVLKALSLETERCRHRLDCARGIVVQRAQAVAELTEQRDRRARDEAERRDRLKRQLATLEAELERSTQRAEAPGCVGPGTSKPILSACVGSWADPRQH